jgi:hypothetical protein
VSAATCAPFAIEAAFSEPPSIPPFNFESKGKQRQLEVPEEKSRLKKIFSWTIGGSGTRSRANGPRGKLLAGAEHVEENKCTGGEYNRGEHNGKGSSTQVKNARNIHQEHSGPSRGRSADTNANNASRMPEDSATATLERRPVTPPERVISPRLAVALQTYSLATRVLDVPDRAPPDRPKAPVMGRRRGETLDG